MPSGSVSYLAIDAPFLSCARGSLRSERSAFSYTNNYDTLGFGHF
jgi:hypothetical protein